jgi:hypothetical protein
MFNKLFTEACSCTPNYIYEKDTTYERSEVESLKAQLFNESCEANKIIFDDTIKIIQKAAADGYYETYVTITTQQCMQFVIYIKSLKLPIRLISSNEFGSTYLISWG